MPNWCNCTYKCEGDVDEVKSLYQVLQSLKQNKTSLIKNDFGNMWLGNLVVKLGGDWKEYRCRGHIYDFSLDDDVLTICQETAWGEQEGVREIIQETYPSICVYFFEEEPGMELYCTNDTEGNYFPERYVFDSYGEHKYFTTINEAAEYVSKKVGKSLEPTEESIQQALDNYLKEQNDEDLYFYFYAVEFA